MGFIGQKKHLIIHGYLIPEEVSGFYGFVITGLRVGGGCPVTLFSSPSWFLLPGASFTHA